MLTLSYKNKFRIIILFLLAAFFQFKDNYAQTPRQLDSLALVALYTSTNGANWSLRGHWNDSTYNMSDWYGITVSGNRVVKIELGSNNLTGTIPSEIGNLDHLRTLDLGNNNLSGTIPSEIDSLELLEELILSKNDLTGSIIFPAGFFISQLKILHLNNNKFTGSISGWRIKELINLNELWFQINELSGTIPPEIGYLTNLIELKLQKNQISGSIPTQINSLTNLEYLDISDNSLTGSIPSEIKNLVYLRKLYLYNNQLSGAIPSGIGDLELSILDLHNNTLDFNIPGEIRNLTLLELLDLSYNNLTGNIPNGIGSLIYLTILDLRQNSLSGSIPQEIGNLSNLRFLNLGSNNISGSIPFTIGGLTSLEMLNISANSLTGIIPEEIGNLNLLTSLGLSANQLVGFIPFAIGNLTSLQELSLNSNLLSAVPSTIKNLVNLTTLNLKNNNLNYFPDVDFELFGLSFIALQDNKLTFYDLEQNSLWVTNSVFQYKPQASLHKAASIKHQAGATVILNMEAGGTITDYKWLLDNVDIPGANQSTYTINSMSSNDVGTYICKATNSSIPNLTLQRNPIALSLSSGVITGPTALFGSDKQTGASQLLVQFQDSSIAGTNPIISWKWDFGDSTTSYLQNPAHIYDTSGTYTVQLIVNDGSLSDSQLKEKYIVVDGVTGINDKDFSLPQNFSLSQNYPNPFNPSTAISYQLSAVSKVSLKVYDILGREIATLVNKEQPIGNYKVNFDASNLPAGRQGLASGIYFYRLFTTGGTGEFTAVKKMVLLR